MKRTPISVVDKLLEIVPDEKEEFRKRLTWLKTHFSFQPPELDPNSWKLLTQAFNELILEVWQRDAIEILTTHRPGGKAHL